MTHRFKSMVFLLGTLLFLIVGFGMMRTPFVIEAEYTRGNTLFEWQAMGPFPGNDVFHMTVNPQNSNELFAATAQGIYRSRDEGDSWQLVLTGFNLATRGDIAIDPITSSNVYAVSGRSIAKSQDGGMTWNVGLINSFIQGAYSIFIDPVTPSVLYLLTEVNGNFRSVDYGDTWQFVSNPGRLLLNPQNPQQLFLSLPTGIHRSEDRGITWTLISAQEQQLELLAIDPYTPTTLYAEQPLNSNQDILWKSVNGGVTWTQVYEGGEGFLINSFAIAREVPSILYFGTVISGTFRSSDGGMTWESINSNLPDILPTRHLEVDPNIGGRIYLSYGLNGIYRSDSRGDSWMWKPEGLGGVGSTGIAVNPQDPSEVFLWQDLLYKSNDGAISWTEIPDLRLGGDRAFSQNPISPTIMYVGTTHQGVLKSINGGGSWQSVNTGLPSGINTYVSLVAVHPLTPNVVLAHFRLRSETYITYDGGATWSEINNLNRSIKVITFHPNDPTIIYAGTQQGLWRTINGGSTWMRVDTNLSLNETIYTIGIDPTSPNTIYIGISDNNPIQKSIDGGVTWNPLNIGVASAIGYDIHLSPLDPTILYAAVSRRGMSVPNNYGLGVFRSVDAGLTWTTENTGIYREVTALGLDPQNIDNLYAATLGLSAFKSRPTQADLRIKPYTLNVIHPQSNGIDTTLPMQLVNRGSNELTWSTFVDGSGAACDAPSPVPWLMTGSTNGVVAPFATTLLPITFHSPSLPSGVYTASLCISSNDPDTPNRVVPLTLTVDATAQPQLSLAPADVEVNLLPDTQAGRQMSIRNIGDAHLNWRVGLLNGSTCEETASLSWLSWSEDEGTTAPEEQRSVGLSFDSTGLAAGTYAATLCLRNNGIQTPSLMPLTLRVSTVPLTPTPLPTTTATASPSATATVSATSTATASPTASATATHTPTATVSATVSATATPAPTFTPTSTTVPSATGTPTVTATGAVPPSVTTTPTAKVTQISTPTLTPTATATLPTEPGQRSLFLPLIYK